MALLRCPAQFWDFRPENYHLVFEPDVQTNGKPASFFFQTNYGRFCIFADRCIGLISQTKGRAFHLLVGWCIYIYNMTSQATAMSAPYLARSYRGSSTTMYDTRSSIPCRYELAQRGIYNCCRQLGDVVGRYEYVFLVY